MPTVEQWQQALTRSYRLAIESSNSLCQEVFLAQQQRKAERAASGQQAVAAKALIPWPNAGQHLQVLIRPIDFLHSLGRITTPPVTELIDLSSTWAEIRYLWAFRPDFENKRTKVLRLNPSVKDLDFHQKTLLSDEFGVGFAAYYMTVFEQATDPIDAFIAKRHGQVRVVGNSRRSLPDYIFTGAGNRYYIVECKGTQSSRSTAINQLQRGSEQVVTVDIDPPASVTRLVIGSWLQHAITVFVVDPEERPERKILSRWSVEAISRFAAAKRLTYVGDHQSAYNLLRGTLVQEESFQIEVRELVARETESGVFLGSEEERNTPDGRRIQMFRGIREDAYHGLVKDSRRSRLTSRELALSRESSEFRLEQFGNRDQATVQSFSADGSLFEIQIS